MPSLKLITEDYKKYIDDRNLQELVDGFVSYHKKIYKKYDSKGGVREFYYKSLLEIVEGKVDKSNYILCFAYDEEQKRAIGFATGIKVSKENKIVWELCTIYLQKKFRGLKQDGKKVSKMLYDEFKIQAKQRGGDSIELGVYSRNDDALRFYNSLGFELKPDHCQAGIPIFKSLNVFLNNSAARKKRPWQLVSLRNSI